MGTRVAQLYPIDGVRDRSGGSRYFIRLLIAKFELNETRYLLMSLQPHSIAYADKRSRIVVCVAEGEARSLAISWIAILRL